MSGSASRRCYSKSGHRGLVCGVTDLRQAWGNWACQPVHILPTPHLQSGECGLDSDQVETLKLLLPGRNSISFGISFLI